MITEDYVSFEVAKLLKEKGFNEQCTYMYDSQHKLYSTFEQCRQVTRSNSDWIHYVGQLDIVPIAAPTHQMTLKWLREVHNLCIEPYRTAAGYLYTISNIPYGSYKANSQYDADDEDSGQYTTYEKACEAAIKYCLINLIK